MKNIFKVLILVLATTASCSFAGAGWRGEAQISQLIINYHNQGVAIVFPTPVSLNNCGIDTDVLLDRTTAGYSEMYSTLLAAYTAKKTVNVWVSGTCSNNRNMIIAIYVKD